MPVRFDQSRKQWVTEFEQTGVRVFRRLPKGCTRAQADALEATLRREIFDRETLDKKPDLTIGDAIDLWLNDNRRKNQRQAQSEGKQWEPWRGKLLRDAPEVAASAMSSWTKLRAIPTSTSPAPSTAGTRSASGSAKASTINRRLMLLKAVCKAMWRQKRIGENLSGRIQTLRENSRREVFLDRSTVRRLAAHAPTKACESAIILLAYTGLRAGELLTTASVEPRSHTLLVAESKTGKPRRVPVALPARSHMRSLPLGLSYWELRKQFMQACRTCGVKDVKLHDLRHTAASWLINAGVDLYTVGKILGHSSPQTTARYAHLATDTLEKAMRRLK